MLKKKLKDWKNFWNLKGLVKGKNLNILIDNKYILFLEKIEKKYKKTSSEIIEALIEKEIFLQKEEKKRKRILIRIKKRIFKK